MKKSSEVFRKAFDKVASGMKMNPNTINDINMYKTSLKELDGGLSDNMSLGDIATKHNVDIEKLTKEFLKGVKVEMEHTDDKSMASEIAMDHLVEDPKYYSKLKKIETKESKKNPYDDPTDETEEQPVTNTGSDWRKKIEGNEATGSGSSGAYSGPLFGGDDEFIKKSDSETPKKIEATEATGSGSVGAYETPAAWAKSTSKKDFRGASKPLYKGGSFVSVKKKCTKFPYCNAGDINALHIYKNESLKEAIKSVASKMNISENTIKAILQYELEKVIK